MELEVSKKVRDAIKAKLLELGCHVDDELPDYIMILIANRRTNVEIESDLSLFLTDSTKKFVTWLTHVLKKLEEVTATGQGVLARPSTSTSTSTTSGASASTSAANISEQKDKEAVPTISSSSSGSKSKEKESKKEKKEREKSKEKEKKLKKKRSEEAKEDVKLQIVKDVFIEVKDKSRSLKRLDKEKERRSVKETSPEVEVEVEERRERRRNKSETRESEEAKATGTSQSDLSHAENESHEAKAPAVVHEESPKRRKIVLKKSHLDTLTLSPRKNAEVRAKAQEQDSEDQSPSSSPQKKRQSQSEGDIDVDVSAAPVADSSETTKIKASEEINIKTGDAVAVPVTDTLILHTEENEFSENLDELRRIALASREKRRISQEEKEKEKENKGHHQRKLITNILMSQSQSSSSSKQRSDRDRDRIKEKDLIARSRSSITNSERERPIPSRSRLVRSRKDSSPSPRRSSRLIDRDRDRDRSSQSKSQKISIFSRIGRRNKSRSRTSRSPSRSNSRSRSRSPRLRSKSPNNKKLTSRIGTVINRHLDLEDFEDESDENPVQRKVSSVIKVTDRPKRDLRMSSKMLLMAVADAQQSIIQKGQSSTGLNARESRGRGRGERESQSRRNEEDRERQERESRGRKRHSDENVRESEKEGDDLRFVAKRRFTEFPEVISDDFNEPTESSVRRKSIKERLGVKREIVRKSVKERLGIINQAQAEETSIDVADEPMTGNCSDDFYNDEDDFNIVINVNDSGISGNAYMEQRNVTLASGEIDASKRISIRVNNSEDDDTDTESDDDDRRSGSSQGDENEVRTCRFKKDSKLKQMRYIGGDTSIDVDGEIQLSISDEDKLPEPVQTQTDSDSEYIVEEIEVEEESPKGSDASPENPPTEEKQVTPQSDPFDQIFSIKIDTKSAPPPPVKPPLPDLRSAIFGMKVDKVLAFSNSRLPITGKPVPVPAPGLGGGPLKCKYWPNCQFKEDCVYKHPKCRFNPCTNVDCPYKHDATRSTSTYQKPAEGTATAAGNKKVVCKFYPKCTSMNCKFHHPSPCRFGVGCTDGRCTNYHPGVSIGVQKLSAKGIMVLPKVNQLKWVKNQQS